MKPKGMTEQVIPLSRFDNGQAELHQMESVRAIAYPRLGDGWVVNQDNGHLAGSILQKRRRVSKTGVVSHPYEILDIDSAMIQNGIVGAGISAEAEAIAGSKAEDGQPIPGELDQLYEYRLALFDWLNKSAAERRGISNYVSGPAERLSGAINPLNFAMLGLAVKMQTLQAPDGRYNPSAMLAMSHPFERNMKQRYRELLKNKQVNDARELRLMGWLFTEAQELAKANLALDEFSGNPDDLDAYLEVAKIAQKIRFRVQPFNQLAFALAQSNDRDLMRQAAQTASSGILWQRTRDYLLQPFRILGAKTLKELQMQTGDPVEGLMPELSERLLALDRTVIGRPYDQLIGRLLIEGHTIVDNLNREEYASALHGAEVYRQLITYMCLPGDPEDLKAPWYSQQMHFYRQNRRRD